MAAIRAADAHLGIRARLDCASTDANIPLSMGLEAVSIGEAAARLGKSEGVVYAGRSRVMRRLKEKVREIESAELES